MSLPQDETARPRSISMPLEKRYTMTMGASAITSQARARSAPPARIGQRSSRSALLPAANGLSSRQQSRERLMSPPSRPVSRSAGGLGSAGAKNPTHLLYKVHSSSAIHSQVAIQAMNGELRHVRSIQGMYRPPYLTCYGNLHWRSKQRLLRPDSKPRFLEYLNKEEEDTNKYSFDTDF